ncbi:MAG TPA: helix-turn-helix transcriptional regulator [Microscillaceae bacterium]|nr:helix-turn-helix transcriptional regulator [Microscillaceae bacterium]
MYKYTNEKEILAALERQAFLIEQKINSGIITLEDLSEELNGKLPIATHNVNTLVPAYLNDNALKILDRSYEEYLTNMDMLVKTLHFPGSYERSVSLVKDHLESRQAELPVSYIQRMRFYGQKDFKGLYTLTKKNKQTGELFNIYIPIDTIVKATNKILRILDDELYMKRHYQKFASLTTREKEIVTLLSLGYQNNEIAEQLFISKATVEQHRKNLKRKLEIKRFVDLIRFAQAFDLI